MHEVEPPFEERLPVPRTTPIPAQFEPAALLIGGGIVALAIAGVIVFSAKGEEFLLFLAGGLVLLGGVAYTAGVIRLAIWGFDNGVIKRLEAQATAMVDTLQRIESRLPTAATASNPAQVAQQQDDSELAILERMRRSGQISDSEYEKQKKELGDSPNAVSDTDDQSGHP